MLSLSITRICKLFNQPKQTRRLPMSKIFSFFMILVALVITGCCQTTNGTTLPITIEDGMSVLPIKHYPIPGVYAYDGGPKPIPTCKDPDGRDLKKCTFRVPAMWVPNIPFFLWTPEGSPLVAIWKSVWDRENLLFHEPSGTLIYKGSMYKPSKYQAKVGNRLLRVWVRP